MPQKIKNVKKKVGRRGNNEGSIFQRKDGRWVAQVTVGYRSNGKPIYKYAYGSSRQEVAKKLTQYTQEVFENGYSSFAPSDTHLFNPLLDDWYVTFKEPTIKSATSEKHRGFMKNHIKPEFENIEVEQIDFFRMQRFFNCLVKKGICLDTIKKIRQLLSQFYKNYLMKMSLVRENPLDDVKIMARGREDVEKENLALTPELRSILFAKLQNEQLLKPILTVLILTGMRPGELIALRWKDVDFKRSTITIRFAVSRDITFDEVGNVIKRKQIISNTKTALSVRSFVAPEAALQCLWEWREYLREQQTVTGIDFLSGDCYTFSTQKGTMRSYSGLRSMLLRFLKKSDLGKYNIKLYTFRHTFATILLEERENSKIVSELMGHAKVQTTLAIYSHVLSRTVYEDTAKTLDSAFRKLNVDNKKTDEFDENTSVLESPEIDSSFDSNADKFRQF